MAWQVIWSMIGILFMIYGVIVSRTGSGTGFFLVWIALGILAFLLAAACRHDIWKKMPPAARKGALAAVLIMLAVFVLVEVLILTGFSKKGRPGLDYVIVPGAQVYAYGPGKVLKRRLNTAAAYLKENEKTICIVSGGQGYNEPAPEAVIMKEYLTDLGISPERILEETASRNTHENIIESMKLMDPGEKRAGIITNDFHVFRSTGIARKAGLKDAEGIAASSARLYLPNNMLREFFGVVKDVLKGNMEL